MKPERYRGLLLINAALLGVLALVTLAPSAEGEQSRRGRGDYTMVGGKIQGSTESVIYVIDTSNQEMLALRWNQSRKALEGIGYRNLAQDAGQTGQRRR